MKKEDMLLSSKQAHEIMRTESIVRVVLTGCAVMAIAAVSIIAIYMIASGTPALFKVGVKELLFSTEWNPAPLSGVEPSYGILYVILTSVIGTGVAILIGAPIGILTAVFLSEIANERLSHVVSSAVELLAAVPSVIYGLLGIAILNPLVYQMELWLFRNSSTHQFTGGANLLSAIVILAIMILPTVINIGYTAIRQVPKQWKDASLALGASHMQTIFKVTLPGCRSGLMTAVILGTGRAIGEAMAINLASGGAVNVPLPFNAVRFLTTAIVSEMAYADGLHRQVLFTIGLILLVFILLINVGLTTMLKKRGGRSDA